MVVKNLGPIQKNRTRIFVCYGVGIVAVILLALGAAAWFATPLTGVSSMDIGRLAGGWRCEGTTVRENVDLPCTLEDEGSRLLLSRTLADVPADKRHVLVFRTQYASIRVWADDRLIYQAAQGEAHALSSMWHFIPVEKTAGASLLQVELVRYQTADVWALSDVLLDHPQAVCFYLLLQHLPVLLYSGIVLILTLQLLLIAALMAGYRIKGILPILTLALFVFLSGAWILLDSKITTLWGGNYAVTYFLSYMAFYLLPTPYLMFLQVMLQTHERAFKVLIWAFFVNAILCLLLHWAGWIAIRNTVFIVHILIILTALAAGRAFWKNGIRKKNSTLRWTFAGSAVLFAAGFVGMAFYYLEMSSTAWDTLLYSCAMLLLIVGMMMDAFSFIGRFWRQQSNLRQYRRLAREDTMTGLENRNAFEACLHNLLEKPVLCLQFLVFDLDNLKTINDAYGHLAGDQALSMVAECVRTVFADAGRCYRIGGDEFCVVITGRIQAEKRIEKCLNLLRERSGQVAFPVEVSYGWAEKQLQRQACLTEKEISDLLYQADWQMYHNKHRRKEHIE